jgi:penicillin-binding protein 1C
MGNFSGETVIGKTGSSIPAEVVRALLDTLVADGARSGLENGGDGHAAERFPLPETYAYVPVCALSGLSPGDACPSVTQEFVPRGLEGSLETCTWHYREGGRVMVRYPGEYQRWFLGKNTVASLFESGEPLSFLYPTDGAVFVYEDAMTRAAQQMAVDVRGGDGNSAHLYVNGALVGESARPFTWNVPLSRGKLLLAVECAGETVEISVTVK